MSIATDLRELASRAERLEECLERIRFCAQVLDSSIRRAIAAGTMDGLSTIADSGYITAASAMTQLMDAVGKD